MTEIRKGRPEEMDLISRFAVEAFSKPGDILDFPAVLPKLYGPGAQTAADHTLYLEDGRLIGLICRQPRLWQRRPGEVYKLSVVGTVSVDRAFRGHGIMAELMALIDGEMRADGTDFATLDGQRQRYRYHGYDKAGVQAEYTVTETNLRHGLGSVTGPEITFAPMPDGSPWTAQAHALHSRLPSRVLRREEDFVQILRSQSTDVYAVLRGGEFAGYVAFSLRGGPIIRELEVTDHSVLPGLMVSLFRFLSLREVKVVLPVGRDEKTAFFTPLCEHRAVTWNHNYRFYNPALEALRDELYIPYPDCL